MLKNRWPLFLISLLATSNVMCLISAYDFDIKNFTKTEPKIEQLAGKYVPIEKTIALIKDEGHYGLQDISISLFSNGTFEKQNMPDWWMPNDAGFGKSNGKFDSGQGKWKIAKNYDGWWEVEFKFETGTFFSSEELNGVFFTTIDLGGEKPPYSLWVYVGDPDSGPLMIFEQAMENP